MPTLLIRRAQLQRRNQLAVAFQLGLLQYARLTVIGTVGRMGYG